ncbi:MAG: alpha/beta hydrolase [Methanobacteriota archaeon]
MKHMRQYLRVIIILLFFISLAQFGSAQSSDIMPPDQPVSGPGGSSYTHAGIQSSRYNYGADMYWIFEPSDPKPESAPLIVFLHGWSAFHPIAYRVWIDHLIKRGNIVVYPRYQRGLYIGFREFDSNAITAVKEAITVLQNGDHVYPELDKFAIVGHSLGGGITMNMAAQAAEVGLPIPKVIMPVQPAMLLTGSTDLLKISNSTLMIVLVGQNDTVVGDTSGKTIFENTTQIPLDQKDFVIQVSDSYGSPALAADHLAPLCLPYNIGETVNAMDYYSTWKLFDALTDYAFYGINREFCLGNTTEQRFMGVWSDGIPVKELMVTDIP